METLTVRISKPSHELLRELSKSFAEPMTEILDRAIKDLRDRRFLEELNASYAALRKNPEAWSEFTQELQTWDATLGDGLEKMDDENSNSVDTDAW